MVTLWGLVIEGFVATQNGLLKEIEERCGLLPAHFDVVLRLLRSPEGALPMRRLAHEAALTSGGFTKVADRMEDIGLIRRVPSELDRRVTNIQLTSQGVESAELARRITADYLRRNVLAPLGVETAEALGESMRALRAANAEPSPNGKAAEPVGSPTLT
ncbi:MarR family transcriptional regulator [Flindersiella endophytica]